MENNSAKKILVKSILLKTALALLAVIIVAGIFNAGRITRLYRVLNLFNADVINENFRTMHSLFDSSEVQPSGKTSEFKKDPKNLPENYTFKGVTKKTADFMERTQTTALIVLRDDIILYENYFRGNTPESKTISWSTSKSILSALFGIAVAEGAVKSIEQKVTDYLPELAASGYNNVRIKDVLQMSSGVLFNEDYADFNSDINRMGRAWALNTPLAEFIASLKPDKKPGTLNHYVSMDTQVLGMILVKATGKSLAEYTEEKLWKPLGMESGAYWLIDSAGMEAAFGGFNAVARDYARFGRLYLNRGSWEGRQIVPAEWVRASVTPDSPHLMPGSNADPEWTMGYGYQWWIPENQDGDFMAIGIYGQAIYVYPKYNIVITKSSAYANYNEDGDAMEIESAEFFRAIARGI